jgi:rod shape-determining protein MreC
VSIEFASRGEGRIPYVVIGLLLLHLALLSIQVEDPAGTLLFKSWVLTAGAPLMNGSASVSREFGDLWTGYLWLHDAREENVRLNDSVRQLVLANRDLAQVREENERLRRLLDVNAVTPYRTLGARVVSRAPNFLSQTLFLDRGTADGIRMNQPVISSGGVIGRTVLVTRYGCQVQLLTNGDASVGVLVERTRTPGVVRGTENLLLDLDYISNTEEVNIGDVILTSGLDGIYPKGLPVGRVVDSQKGRTGFRTVKVEPGADLVRIEEVLIVLGGLQSAAGAPAPGAADVVR